MMHFNFHVIIKLTISCFMFNSRKKMCSMYVGTFDVYVTTHHMSELCREELRTES